MEKDAEIQEPGEIPKDESEDGSPETNQDVDDPDNEENDQSMFNFVEEPPEDEDEDRNDTGGEERNVQED